MGNNSLRISGERHEHPLKASMVFFFFTSAQFHIKSQLAFESSSPQHV